MTVSTVFIAYFLK